MKKIIKKILAAGFVAATLLCVNLTTYARYVPLYPLDGDNSTTEYSDDAFHSDMSIKGFDVGNLWKAYDYDKKTNSMNFFEEEYKEKSIINHYTTLDDVLLVSKYNSNIYAYIYKVTFTPYQVRDYGFFGIGSSGDNWFFRSLVSECELPSTYRIIDYSPKNTPESWTESIGGSFGLDSGGTISAQISCSTSYNVSELEIESNSTYMNKFKTNYIDYKCSKYTKNSTCFYGMFVFQTSAGQKPNIVVKHTCQYFGQAYYGIDSHGLVEFNRPIS